MQSDGAKPLDLEAPQAATELTTGDIWREQWSNHILIVADSNGAIAPSIRGLLLFCTPVLRQVPESTKPYISYGVIHACSGGSTKMTINSHVKAGSFAT